ncbi:MBL fold metallo-hydrolase [Jatrophihabitans endophyticus]|uniref:MBL fold metallo-hydrolase n=1 Tax=Jatrophihabitans endophyticus TaxID=1206085 RepID=UPI0019D9ADC0|nr:MBL fold metallo-hydrolase [Jatrophihabitans endophyticus]MBE7189368.1 MBL fold metallo-hydrolase [Jatrophihabitans endophyticus]
MQLTKFRHSCVRFDEGDRSFVVDPGAFSDLDAALDGVEAILITHEHFDHIDTDRVSKALRDDSRLRLFGPQGVVDSLAEFGEQVEAVGPDQSFEAAGLPIKTFGHQHAVIHPLVPFIANVGYLVADKVFHPGDSFTVPPTPVETVLLPSMAPWAKLSEIVDYAVAVRAPRAFPIHDALVNDLYDGILGNVLKPLVARYGVDFGAFDEPVDA